jgi:hypothetical protein
MTDPTLTTLSTAYPGYTWTRRTRKGVPTYTGTLPDGWALVKVRQDRFACWKATLRIRDVCEYHDYALAPERSVALARASWRAAVAAGQRDLDAAAGGGAP